jgi:hypothetical protein
MLQHLMYNDIKPSTLYIDIDEDMEVTGRAIDLNDVLNTLRTEFNTDKIYFVKNDLKDKYHMFLP